MSLINLNSTEALLALDNSLGESADTLENAIAVARSRAEAMIARLEAHQAQCQQQVHYWQDRIDSADEDESTDGYYEQLEKWQEKLERTVRSLALLENAFDNAQGSIRQIENLAAQTPRARAFLRRRAAEIEEYAALKTGGGASSAGGSSGSSASIGAAASMPSITGYRRSKPDARDWLWSKLYGPVPPDLPARKMLESFLGPAHDQKATPQCVCYSLAALKHHDEFCSAQKWLHFDPEPIYSQCKARDGAAGEDGTTIRDAMKVAVKTGLAADDGARYFARGYARLQTAEEICHALSLNKVVLLGVQIAGASLSALKDEAVVPIPEATDGGHCMTVVGYDAAQRMFRVRNSWGTDWGDSGHCWLPFFYLANESDLDAWTTVCEQVEIQNEVAVENTPAYPNREISPASNFAWFDPQDVVLSDEDGAGLDWTRITPEFAGETLEVVTKMRPFLPLAELKSNSVSALEEKLAQATDATGRKIFADTDLEACRLYFGNEAIRIDSDGQGGFMVINGRHRLYRAQQTGLRSILVSISNAARRQLKTRIEEEK